MLNQVVLVGRIYSIEYEISEKQKCAKIIIASNRHFKNEEGIYETDLIPCILYNNIAEQTVEYCKKGDVVGIKGRIAKLQDEELKIIAEKVTFLSSKKPEESEGKINEFRF